jgi:Outer membrane protein Omp28
VVLPLNNPNTGNTFDQNILVEEYTGVRCQNCPAGAQLLEELKTIHGKRLTILSIHGGFFAQPTNLENKLKLDNSFGQQLITVFNQPQGYPSAMINRKLFDGQSSLFLGGSFWAGYINQEKNKLPQVGLEIKNILDSGTRRLTVEITVIGLVDLSALPLRLSVALTENNIKDAQLTPVGIDTNYIHQHVMRTFLGNVFGNVLDPITLNQAKSYTFNFPIPAEWDLDQLNIVAFIHKPGTDYEVIQVGEKKLR